MKNTKSKHLTLMRSSITQKLLLSVTMVSAITTIGVSTAICSSHEQPNIVLLISDDDDYEHFGFMGSKIAQTPTLDKLVAAGTLFTTAHCPAPLCRPSLASMLSGQLPNQHGIYGNYIDRTGIGKDTIKLAPTGSLPNRLKHAGYATYATGKYWEGDPRTMGFTHGTVDVTIMPSDNSSGRDRRNCSSSSTTSTIPNRCSSGGRRCFPMGRTIRPQSTFIDSPIRRFPFPHSTKVTNRNTLTRCGSSTRWEPGSMMAWPN